MKTDKEQHPHAGIDNVHIVGAIDEECVQYENGCCIQEQIDIQNLNELFIKFLNWDKEMPTCKIKTDQSSEEECCNWKGRESTTDSVCLNEENRKKDDID